MPFFVLTLEKAPAALDDILKVQLLSLFHLGHRCRSKRGKKDFANPPAWHIMHFRHSLVKGVEIMLDKKKPCMHEINFNDRGAALFNRVKATIE